MGVNRVIVPALLLVMSLTLLIIGIAVPPVRGPMFIASGVDFMIAVGILLFGLPNRTGR